MSDNPWEAQTGEQPVDWDTPPQAAPEPTTSVPDWSNPSWDDPTPVEQMSWDAQDATPDWSAASWDAPAASPLAAPLPEEPSQRGGLVKRLAVVGASLALLAGVGVGGVSLYNAAQADSSNPPAAAPPTSAGPVTAPTQEPTAPSELDQLRPFADELARVMTERDVQGYWALLDPQSQKLMDISQAEAALSKLQAGARYTASLKEASIAGTTALVKLELTTTLGTKVTTKAMKAELYLVDGVWRMRVGDKCQ